MDMQASRALSITQQQAWDALNDPEVLKTCIPGCDRIEASGENQYTIGMAVKIGPVAAKFGGSAHEDLKRLLGGGHVERPSRGRYVISKGKD